MELREFIRDVLVQIAHGVKDADAEVIAAGGVASPATRSGPVSEDRETHFATLESGAPVFLVDFDVAVTVSETTDQGGKAGLRIASVFSGEFGGKSGESTATVSRVRFKVPIALPVNAASAEKVRAAKEKASRPINRPPGGGQSWMGR